MTIEQSSNALAVASATAKVMLPHNLAPATVSYSTYGHLLITGPEDRMRLVAEQLKGMASITLLATEKISNLDEEHLEKAASASPELKLYEFPLNSVKGFLGQYLVSITHAGQTENLAKISQNRVHFDLILNLADQCLFGSELPPAGYFHVREDDQNLAAVISDLPNYIGEFQKPKYFHINNDICAHSSRGQTGCTRCLDVCPADAISSINDLVNIDPHMCHGAGGCATACPTGAISYALPQPLRMHEYLQRLLQAYQAEGGSDPVVLLHDHEAGAELVTAIREQIADNVLPVQLEELAAAGQESWLLLAASGAKIRLLKMPALPESMDALLKREIKVTQQILTGIGCPADTLEMIDADQLISGSTISNDLQLIPIKMVTDSNKRDVIFTAINHLVEQSSESTNDSVALPAGAPFGQVKVDNAKCTLCLSCVAVCPTQALTAGGETPALNFVEQSCVQCGLCDSACPENAIQLETRLSLVAERSESICIHKEDAFECISCGKPFAPKSTVEKMVEKLSQHRFFQGEAVNRLKMCEDCRVNDIYTDLAANPAKQLEL
ncbi:4Fe-4S binding protein [Neptuniibacter caesariensis]|uniref:Iron-sulfur cluster-binding protein n=1 Tax=Neptuniibacter caesariensis TaxID=207954 RepID=A0A7U8C5R4_NEPCE|nr:4Fe-4S binding protein [Neptuniibacter caesariensis]EAR62073.1 iron-sulfur cluster-binding protein [Oceanospirillum sp. MED92] [Neptuniibacter caesariensis]